MLVARLLPTSVLTDGPRSAPFAALLVLGTFVLIWVPGLIVVGLPAFLGLTLPARSAFAIVISAAIGWVILWVWFLSPTTGKVLSAALIVATLVAMVVRGLPEHAGLLLAPFGLAALVAVLYTAIGADHGDLSQGALGIAHRYWVAVDGAIPKLFDDALLQGRGTLLDFLPGTQSSERPALESGMIMSAYWAASLTNRTVVYLALGVATNAIWVVALWNFLRCFRLTERRIAIVAVTVVLAGPVFLNTLYAWPKMLAAALTLSAATIVLDTAMRPMLAAVGAASAAALAFLSHGSSAFGLIGLIVLVIAAMPRWRVRATMAGAALAALIYAPWIAYTNLFDPPGDYLIKWHLAGLWKHPVAESAAHAVIRRYTEAGPLGVAENKVSNLEAFFGTPSVWSKLIAHYSQPAWSSGLLGFLRQWQSSSMIPATGLLLIGIVAALVVPRVRSERWVAPIMTIVVIGAGAFLLIEFGGDSESSAWLHHGPYLLLLLLLTAGALGITALPRPVAIPILALHGAIFVVLWVLTISAQGAFDPTDRAGWEPAMIVVEILSAAGIGVLGLTRRREVMRLSPKAPQSTCPSERPVA